MKFSKLKVFVTCILLAFSISAFITSCSSEESIELESTDQLLIEKGLLLPIDISSKGKEFVEKHLTDISKELKITYRNNYIVGQYLVHIGKAESILDNLEKWENLSELDLSDHLSTSQIKTMESEMIDSMPDIQIRGCTPIYEWNNCCWRNQWNQCVGCWKLVGWYC